MTAPSRFRFTPGALVYWLYHRPRTWWRDRRDREAAQQGEKAMLAAAVRPAPSPEAHWAQTGPAVRFLTGKRFLHQTIFCARSFEWACGTRTQLEIFSDGTLGPEQLALLRQALPHATAADGDAICHRLETLLPVARFPHLRRMRDRHPLMRKLLDLHVGGTGPSLYLDSDMLFFGEPQRLRQWLHRPTEELFMQQHGDALVADRTELGIRLGLPLLPGVNSGILALDDAGFDWEFLETMAARLTEEERSHPWAEQTLFALHVSRRQARPLSPQDYFLCHSAEDLTSSPPPLRHYVHKSKMHYAASEWRRWLELREAHPGGPGKPAPLSNP